MQLGVSFQLHKLTYYHMPGNEGTGVYDILKVTTLHEINFKNKFCKEGHVGFKMCPCLAKSLANSN